MSTVLPPESKATTQNPKDLFGSKKVSITKLPAVAILHGAHAMMDGARKYGPYNWRDKKVVASIYADAATRHILSWFEGEECASDSGVHHLGHAIACCAILLDAQESGNLIDDRPVNEKTRGLAASVLERLNAVIAAKAAALAGPEPQAAAKTPAGPDPGHGWRLLKPGEVIQQGDEYRCAFHNTWRDSSDDAGNKFEPEGSYFLPRRRRV
jgi:hypothetical protein